MLIAQKGSVAAAEQELRDNGAAPAVAALRDYTDYLTPHAGVLSDDTWAGIVLYIRNVLINWLAFLPVFVLAVIAAIVYRTLLWTVSAYNAVGLVALGIGAAAIVLSTWRACRDLPSHRPTTQSDHGCAICRRGFGMALDRGADAGLGFPCTDDTWRAGSGRHRTAPASSIAHGYRLSMCWRC